MAKTYDEKIGKYTDWGGDLSTSGLPVSGKRIQEYIKEGLNSKVGIFYKAQGDTMVYGFADEEGRDKYLVSGDTSTILSSFETISKYSVAINTDTLTRSYSVVNGTTGNSFSFDFKIVDDNDMVVDSKASIEVSFLSHGIVEKYTVEKAMNAEGWTNYTSDVIDKYLKNGENTLTIAITGLSSRATSQFIITYNVFDLNFSCDFKYNEVQTGESISISYDVSCTDTKYLEYFIDGFSATSVESMVIPDYSKKSSSTLDISSLSAGQHTLQVGCYTKAKDGTQFHSDYRYYSFAKYGNEDTVFLMNYNIGNKKESLALSGNPLTLNVTQFDIIKFDWSIYSKTERKYDVIFEYRDIEGKTEGTLPTVTIDKNGEINSFTFRPMVEGNNKMLKIYSKKTDGTKWFEKIIYFNVKKNESGIKETTDKLLLKLESRGRRNDEGPGKRDKWEYKGYNGTTYKTTFNNFKWNEQCGWDETTETLVISNGASIEVDLKPMSNDWAKNGGALEIDLETFDIENDNAVIFECKDNISGKTSACLKITATDASFSTNDGISINTKYKDNEKLKIVFIGNKYDETVDGKMIYIVVNGVLERAALMQNSTDKILSNSTLKIGDVSGNCKVRIRSIRAYDKAITVDEAFNNYVIDSTDIQTIYEKNNVLDATGNVDFDLVANKLPVMIFTGDMPKLCEEGQSTKTEGKWYPFDMEYINRQHPELNFLSFNCQMKLQGTSSLGYPRKNFKLKTKDKTFNKDAYEKSIYEIDPDSVVGNKMLRNKITKQRIDFGTLAGQCFTFQSNSGDTSQYKPLNKGKYRFKTDSHKADKWTLKADFMESSCSHNVGAGRSWNSIFENTKLTTGAGYNNNTYQDSAVVCKDEYKEYTRPDGVFCKININGEEIKKQSDYVCRTDAQKICHAEGADDIRTAVDGFPMVCYYRLNHSQNNLIFMGQYNFINDKSSYEVFGFEDIEKPDNEEIMIYDADKVEVWEGLKNANPISLFHTIKNWDSPISGCLTTYESRYPDPDDYGVEGKKWYDASSGSPLYELSKWLVSTRHGKDASGNTIIYDLEGNIIPESSQTLSIDSNFAEHINNYQYGYTEDTKMSYQYDKGVNIADTAENRQKKFNTEKWEHFDVWKLAGYYIYLMRYGAVDQFVKNTMLFTDGNGKYDGREAKKYRKWFFINYDNDCLFGLRNNGQLAFGWDLDRQTKDGVVIPSEEEPEVNTYAMMGHESTLWNNLEADDEFMRMVRDLDNSMNAAGLNYSNMVNEFDTKQTEQWCERIYNANEKYKYIDSAKGIGDMSGKTAVDNLWMLQGTRRSHRHWWIANHFNLLDAKWLSGNYKQTYMMLKMTTPKTGVTFTGVAGENYYFAWGQQKKIYESNIVKKEGETITFISKNDVQGDPVQVYAFNKMSELNCSNLAPYIFEGSFEFHIGNDKVANRLKKFIIGNPNHHNCANIPTTSWKNLSNLTYLDITNFEGITSIPYSSLKNLQTLKASGSSIASFAPAEGSKFTLVELPTVLTTLSLKNISFNNIITTDLVYTPNKNLETLEIANNDGIGNEYYLLIKTWINDIEASSQAASIYKIAKIDINNINWSFSNISDVKIFANFSKYAKENFKLRGTIDLTSCGSLSKQNINELKEIFGENCFSKDSPLYIKSPSSIFILSDKNEMIAGESNTFSREIYPDESAASGNTIEYLLVKETDTSKSSDPNVIEDPVSGKHFLPLTESEISATRSGITLNISGGVLSSQEIKCGTDTSLIVLVRLIVTASNFDKVSFMNFIIKDPTYATKTNIIGEIGLYKNKEYTFKLNALTADDKKPLGSYSMEWSLSGDSESLSYISSSSITSTNDLIITIGNEPEISSTVYVKNKYINNDNKGQPGTIIESFKKILILNSNVIMTSEVNPIPMSICFDNGLCANSDAMLKSEAEAVTSSQLGTIFKDKINNEFTFNEFRFFTGIQNLPDNAFKNSYLTDISLPDNLLTLGNGSFMNCEKLTVINVVDESGAEIKYNKTLPNNITKVSENCFNGCKNLSQLTLSSGVTTIENYAFGNTGFKHLLVEDNTNSDNTLNVSNELSTISMYAFENVAWVAGSDSNQLETFSISKNLDFKNAFQPLFGKKIKKIIVDKENNQYKSDELALFSKDESTIIRFIPNRTENIDKYEVAKNIRSISKYAFLYVQNVKEVVTSEIIFPYGLGDGIFMYSNIEKIDLSPSKALQKMPSYAFYGCEKLVDLSYPSTNSLETFGTNVFYKNPLSAITIPSGVKKLEYEAFSSISQTVSECSGITSFELPDTIVEEDAMGLFVLNKCHNVERVKLPKYWKGMNNPIFNATTTSSKNALINDCNGIKNIILSLFSSNDITYNYNLGNRILYNCPNLIDYILPNEDDRKLYDICDGNLYNGDKKSLVRVPYGKSGITMIEGSENITDGALTMCTKLSVINLSSSLKYLPSGAFKETAVINITIPSGITTVPNLLFHSISTLKNVIFLGPIKSIEITSIRCTNVESITILNKKAAKIYVSTPSYEPKDDEGNNVLHRLHPFGENSDSFCGFRTKNNKILYLPYGYDSSTTVSIVSEVSGNTVYNLGGYNQKLWKYPLLTTEYKGTKMCGFIIKYCPINTNDLWLKVYKEGVELTEDTLYAKSESNDYNYGLNIASATYQGISGYNFTVSSNIYDSEKIYIYTNTACTEDYKVGEITASYNQIHYQIGEPNLLLSTPKVFTSNNLEGSKEPAEITKEEYEKLLSKVNQLTEIIKKIK